MIPASRGAPNLSQHCAHHFAPHRAVLYEVTVMYIRKMSEIQVASNIHPRSCEKLFWQGTLSDTSAAAPPPAGICNFFNNARTSWETEGTKKATNITHFSLHETLQLKGCVQGLQAGFVFLDSTEISCIMRSRFGEVCSCCIYTVLPDPA